jgi:hypothetical protein
MSVIELTRALEPSSDFSSLILAYNFKGKSIISVPFVTLGLIYFSSFLLKVKRSCARLVTMRVKVTFSIF